MPLSWSSAVKISSQTEHCQYAFQPNSVQVAALPSTRTNVWGIAGISTPVTVRVIETAYSLESCPLTVRERVFDPAAVQLAFCTSLAVQPSTLVSGSAKVKVTLQPL